MMQNELSRFTANHDKATYLTVAQEVLMDQYLGLGKPGLMEAAKLATALKSVVWATTTHSQASADRIWNTLEGQQLNMADISTMTASFCLRVDWRNNAADIAQDLATAIRWRVPGKEVDVQPVDSYVKTFRENPWLVFLCCLAHSSAVLALAGVTGTVKA